MACSLFVVGVHPQDGSPFKAFETRQGAQAFAADQARRWRGSDLRITELGPCATLEKSAGGHRGYSDGRRHIPGIKVRSGNKRGGSARMEASAKNRPHCCA
jgi:hypothetical protein